MRLHEYEAKRILSGSGIVVPEGKWVRVPEEAACVAADIGGLVFVKAQVLVGGRGKAGGIRKAENPDEASAAAADILATPIRDEVADGLLVEAALEVSREIYLGITVSAEAGRPVAVVSARGGVDIEETARQDPSAVVTRHIDPREGLSAEDAAGMVRDAGVPAAVADTLHRLYEVFCEYDAVIAEINPLVCATGQDGLVAVDAVLEVDDAALFRHPDLSEIADHRPTDPRARAARSHGMTFVGLEGDIGLICSGAGLGMATIDLIGEHRMPANFLETGGGITRELMAEAARIVMGQPGLKAVLVNIYGGINPIHEGAKGIADVLVDHPSIPVVAKALGNFQEETWSTLEAAGVRVVREVETEAAVEVVLRSAELGRRSAEEDLPQSTA